MLLFSIAGPRLSIHPKRLGVGFLITRKVNDIELKIPCRMLAKM